VPNEGATGPVGVIHSVKLHISSPDELFAWNTMPIVLASSEKITGEPVGSLTCLPPKKKIPRPPPYTRPSKKLLYIFLAFMFAFVTASLVAAEAGIAYVSEREPITAPVFEAVGLREPIVSILKDKGVFAGLDSIIEANKDPKKKAEEEKKKKSGPKLSKAGERLAAKREQEEKAGKKKKTLTKEEEKKLFREQQEEMNSRYKQAGIDLSDDDKEFMEVIRPAIENLTKAEKYDMDAVSDLMDDMSDDQVRKMMRILNISFTGEADAWDADEARDQCVKSMTQIAQAHHAQEFKRLNRKDKMEVALKKKPLDQIKNMLEDCELPYEETATAKELREYALEVDLLDKYDALPATLKLERNKARAIQGAKAYDERKAYEKAKDKYEKELREEEMNDKHGFMHDSEMMKTYHPWEVEWDQEMEIEALERLRQLPLWSTMSPDMLDNMMSRIRTNPKVLDMIESETNSLKQLRDQFGPNGEMPSMDVMRSAGMDMKMQKFKKDKKEGEDALGADAAVAGATAAAATM